MIHAGATPETVQKLLGHASVAFTVTVYGHIFDADLDDLADRLENLGGDADGMVGGQLTSLDRRYGPHL
jgi:hypothetical protein